MPQYETPRRTTRNGHCSQTLARAVQLTAVFPAPICRSFADAALAIAIEMERNEFPEQVKQAMQWLSDVFDRNCKAATVMAIAP